MADRDRRLFIYYRVQAAAVEQAIAVVQGVQADLRARHPGLEAALLRRPPHTDQVLVTLMETYALPATTAGVDVELQRTIETLAGQRLAGLVDGERHIEVFEPCA